MSAFSILDHASLEQVCGGTGGESVEASVGVTARKGNVQAGVQVKASRSDYAKCVSTVAAMPAATPADIRATCGLPPAQ